MKNDESVTVAVTRRVLKGRENEYRELFDDATQLSKRLPGYLGATLQQSANSNEFHSIFRSDTIEYLRQWEESNERKDWMAKLRVIIEQEIRAEQYIGLKFLFSPELPNIPKLKMMLVLIIVIFVMIHTIRQIVVMVFPLLADSAQLLIAVVIQVAAMTYIVMPLVTRLLIKCSR